jgi:uncharacterized repeat protein (TIGR03803 family)
MMLAAAITSPAQTTFNTLVNFDGTNGANPYNIALIQGPDGNLYGTTFAGGQYGLGTVFNVTPTGNLTTLWSFAGAPADGANPMAGLVLGTDGNFYGTTSSGGANGFGTVFSMPLGGVVSIMYSFCSLALCADGDSPEAPLIQAADGNFYGTTAYGGTACAPTGCNGGTVFRITSIASGGMLTSLFGLDPVSGQVPEAALVQAPNLDFYGTTTMAGSGCCGTVFSITSFGQGGLTAIYNFAFGATGADPQAALSQASNGIFYGTTPLSGANNGGAVFSITSGGTLATLYSFCSLTSCADGSTPVAGLIQATNGIFYGTTALGGTRNGGGSHGLCLEDAELVDGCGTIFEIKATGQRKTLHNFDGNDGFNGTDGSVPLGGNALVQATNGTFYGTTFSGGPNAEGLGNLRDGTLFSLSVGLAPFVKTLPTAGKVGTAVIILGTDLAGATSVTFNGTEAVYTVVSPTEITTTVPTGATSGKVEVVTPSGTLTSNVKFRVAP